jgi:hypothetical protein
MRWILLAFAVAACSNETKTPDTAPPPPAEAKATTTPPGSTGGAETKGAAAGPRVEGQGFVVEVQQPAAAQVGAAATAQLVLKPTSGYHVNKEFPTQLEITAPAGVDVPKAKLGPSDAARFEETGAEFAIGFTAKEAGAKKFTATFRFAVCTETTCDPKRETLAWNVDVK